VPGRASLRDDRPRFWCALRFARAGSDLQPFSQYHAQSFGRASRRRLLKQMARILWSDSENRLVQSFGWWLEALVLRSLWWLVTPLSIDRASAAGRRIFALLGPRSAKHQHVLANLSIAFPDRSRAEIEGLALGVWGNVGAVAAEFAQLKKLTDTRRNRDRIEIVTADPQPGALAGDTPCVFVTAHCANWELAAYAAQQLTGALDVVYTPQDNPYLDRMIQGRRRALGCGFIGKVNAVRSMFKSLRSGRSVGLLVDTRVDEAPLQPFFGVDANVTTTPAWLALKTGCPIVPIQVERRRDARFRIIFHPALRVIRQAGESTEQAVNRVTRDVTAMVEAWIRAHPSDWMCTKRRWPKDLMRARGAYRSTPGVQG
jgi:KDO2-lipid IV(A) lauroyltransferase